MAFKSETYELYSDLFEREAKDFKEITEVLSNFRLQDVLVCLLKINTILAKGRLNNEFYRTQDILCGYFFDDVTIERINKKYVGKRKTSPVFFTRLHVLFLIRLCAQVCSNSENKSKVESDEEQRRFGSCCLWISDYLHTAEDARAISEGTDDERKQSLGPQLGVLLELSSPPDFMHSVVRADLLYSELIHTSKAIKIGSFNLHDAFYKATRLTIEQFCNFIFFIVAWFYGHSIDDLLENESQFFINRDAFFSLTSISPEDFQHFLELTSITPERFPVEVGQYNGGAFNRDFTPIRTTPLLELPEGAIGCLDLDYLIEKLSTGFYWTVVEKFSGTEREAAQSAFGYLFEEYVNRIFRKIFKTPRSEEIPGPFVESPSYISNGYEAFDGMLISPQNPRHLFVFQYKSQFIKPKIKYSDNTARFERALDHKGMFGIGKKCGVKQLVKNLEIIWHRDKNARLELSKESIKGITKVTPILVVQENFFRFDFLNWTLNNRFLSLLKEAQISDAVDIAPLIVIDINSLEVIKPYLNSGVCTFAEIINSLNFVDKERVMSLFRYLGTYLDRFEVSNNNEVESRFFEIMERVKRLFRVC